VWAARVWALAWLGSKLRKWAGTPSASSKSVSIEIEVLAGVEDEAELAVFIL
jgi:hypothetical protein